VRLPADLELIEERCVQLVGECVVGGFIEEEAVSIHEVKKGVARLQQ
jgi:hypothetical protein